MIDGPENRFSEWRRHAHPLIIVASAYLVYALLDLFVPVRKVITVDGIDAFVPIVFIAEIVAGRERLLRVLATRLTLSSAMVVLGTTAALSIGAFLVTVVEHRPMYWVDYLLRTQSFPLWCLQLASNVICGPLVEEIVFRGVLQSFLTNRFGSSVAIAIVAVVFGLAHYAQGAMGAVQVAMLTVVGLALGILRHRFHSIGPSYAVHGLYNLSLGLLEFHAPP